MITKATIFPKFEMHELPVLLKMKYHFFILKLMARRGGATFDVRNTVLNSANTVNVPSVFRLLLFIPEYECNRFTFNPIFVITLYGMIIFCLFFRAAEWSTPFFGMCLYIKLGAVYPSLILLINEGLVGAFNPPSGAGD